MVFLKQLSVSSRTKQINQYLWVMGAGFLPVGEGNYKYRKWGRLE